MKQKWVSTQANGVHQQAKHYVSTAVGARHLARKYGYNKCQTDKSDQGYFYQ